MSFKSFIKSRFALQSGVSLVELTIALSLFAIVAVGAFSALTVFDQTKQNQITQKIAALILRLVLLGNLVLLGLIKHC